MQNEAMNQVEGMNEGIFTEEKDRRTSISVGATNLNQ